MPPLRAGNVPGSGSEQAVDAGTLLAASPLDALDARVLLCHALGWRRTELITRAHVPLDAVAVAAFKRLEARRAAGEPVAQLVGAREFYGRRFAVTAAVLIPRPDTELLVELALADIDRRAAAPVDARVPHRTLRILDLGTGSGAIAVTIAAERPAVSVVATDRSEDALAVARANAAALLKTERGPTERGPTERGPTLPLDFLTGDWFGALDDAAPRKFDLIVSNPPYIAATDPHLENGDLRFEPRGALTDEGDGLGAIRAIAAGAPRWLLAGGALMIEHGYDQGEAVRRVLVENGLQAVVTARDLGDRDRVTCGRFAPPASPCDAPHRQDPAPPAETRT
ncbi:peptide chain release factor N(5)-glutamine methyltransferase [Robbsia sp. Bb-Pol-6]|uniref:Release factor glutamine methyltransferase n=1 Tax=Robbsia betulipollinis TaxID=2981849 RepID=A0ABT3ZQP7_9BURK|nr:peptide chain release factor N(5)-glutamine methyltransferase [Robbsia betulipollinis]MCY0388218.1 peptide chain release factor N(5)-glutamine methyltransferase [Robbsia betulipollinis]